MATQFEGFTREIDSHFDPYRCDGCGERFIFTMPTTFGQVRAELEKHKTNCTLCQAFIAATVTTPHS